MDFEYENQGTSTFLVYRIKGTDEIDTMSLGMLTNNKITGLIPAVFTQLDEVKYVKFNVSAKVSVQQFFSGAVNRKRLLGVFMGIVDAMMSAEEYMIDPNTILLDMDYIFTDVTTCDTSLICLPIMAEKKSALDLNAFFKQIMFSTQFDSTENCDYVAKIINYLNSSPVFSLEEFYGILKQLRYGTVATTPSSVPPQTPANTYKPPKKVAVAPAPTAPAPAGGVEQLKPSAAPVAPQAAAPAPAKPAPSAGKKKETKIPQAAAPAPNMGFAIPGQGPASVSGPGPQAPKMPAPAAPVPPANGEKEMTMFNLLCHYSKENKQLYNEQKARKKAQKEAEKLASGSQPIPGYSMPGQPAAPIAPAKPAAPVAPVSQPATPHVVPVQSAQPVAAPSQPSYVAPAPMMGGANFGETTVLGGGVEAGGTTVLGMDQPQTISPYMVRVKTGEKIRLDKPVYRFGKERSYVDYFIANNTAVSRSHANVITRGDSYFIVDTNSTNHTYVNGQMIQSNVETKLENGTKVRMANEEFEFYLY